MFDQLYFELVRIVKKIRKAKMNSQKPPENESIKSKIQSMKDSQGKSDFSGSAYNGPGNVDHEKKKLLRY